jgi:hypothetical protein
VGEFLSEPLSKEQVQFKCKTFNSPSPAEYQSFFNVGIWKDVESFERTVNPSVTDPPKEPFEFKARERMILSPISWRIGSHKLPVLDSFA